MEPPNGPDSPSQPLGQPGWPEGFRERFDQLEPLSDDFEIPEPLPPSPHRDEVLRAGFDWPDEESSSELGPTLE